MSSTFDYNKRLLKEARDVWRHITNFFEVSVEKTAMFSYKMFPDANFKDQLLERIYCVVFLKSLVSLKIYELCPVQRIFLEQPWVAKYWAITFDIELILLRIYGTVNMRCRIFTIPEHLERVVPTPLCHLLTSINTQLPAFWLPSLPLTCSCQK